MTKPILIKKSFNGGELSPELHFRDDLAAYVKGAKHLDNMQATPYGAVTRRPPMELMAKIDTALYGIPVKYIPFKFSLTEVFNIVFTDGSGSESPDSSTADIIIFDDAGNLVILEGTDAELTVIPAEIPAVIASGFTAILNTIYAVEDLNDIHFINVNDFVYLTCGGNYPVQRINRFFDPASNSNRWKVGLAPFKGGPFLDPNTETGKTLTTSFPEYDAGTTYAIGDQVWGVSAGLSASGPVWAYVSPNIYKLRLTVITHPFKANDEIHVEGVVLTGGVDAFFRGTTTPALGGVDGNYIVSLHTGNTFFITLYVEILPGGTLPTFAAGSIEVWAVEDYGGFFQSQQDSNTGELLSDDSFWLSFDRYSGLGAINSNTSMFGEGDVGRLINITAENLEGTSGDWTFDQSSKPIIAGSLVELTTSGGAWGGKLSLQESKDGGFTWEDVGSIESLNGSFNGSIERDISEPSSLVRVKLTDYVTAVPDNGVFQQLGCKWSIKTPNGVNEIYEITAFIDSTTVTVIPITPVDRPRTDYRWSLGAWSETSGYPYSLTIHDERLVLGGCKEKPNTTYASRVNEWDNFLSGFLETSPYQFTIAADSFDAIRSLKSSRQLNIFTDNSENTMGSREDGAVTSVTNIAVSSHTNYGSSHVQAIQMADMIWFVMGQSRRLRASRYDFASDAQQSIEMSLFASHITESGIKEMSFRRHPFNTLFCVLNNGTACNFTYEGTQEVQAWSPLSTAGNIISAYANYSDAGDIVNGIVERNGFYYLERFGSNDSDTVYLDNFVKYVDQDFTLGVPLKQGYTDSLIVVCDDAVLTEGDDYTIVAGVLTIPSATCTTITVGIPFTSRINPTDVTEHGPNGSLRRLSALALYLLDSGDCEIYINGKESNFTAGSRLAIGDRLEGRHEMTTKGGYAAGCDVNILVTNHKPFTLTGLGYRLTVNP